MPAAAMGCMRDTTVMNRIFRRPSFARRAWLPLVLACLLPRLAAGQDPSVRFGEVVPRDVREIYDRGLQYLASSQQENGDWDRPGPILPGTRSSPPRSV